MNETRTMARFVCGLTYSDLPKVVIDRVKMLLLDHWGVELAFSTLPVSKNVVRFVRDNAGDRRDSTIVNYGLRTTADEAAFANSSFAAGFEMDDADIVAGCHHGAVVIPCAFALGERELIDGKEFITAVAAGYEVMSRIGAATRSSLDRGFDPTGILGPFGAASVTSKILGFDEKTTLNALSIAADCSSGLLEFSLGGGEVKRVRGSLSIRSGMRAALLARSGITGPPTALEGSTGFCQAFTNEYQIEEITRDLGKDFGIFRTGNKPYCCCQGNHAAIDAVYKMKKEHDVDPGQVEEITVGMGRFIRDFLGEVNIPKDLVAAQFNIRFNVAMALVKGSNTFEDYTEESLRDPEILDLFDKVNPVVDDDMEKIAHVSNGAKVTIKLKNGTLFKERVDFAKGTVQNPMTEQELLDKFRSLAATVLPNDRVENIRQVVDGLQKLRNIAPIGRLLSADSGSVTL